MEKEIVIDNNKMEEKRDREIVALQSAWDEACDKFNHKDNREVRNVAIRAAFIAAANNSRFESIIQDDLSEIFGRDRSIIPRIKKQVVRGWFESVPVYRPALTFFATKFESDIDNMSDNSTLARKLSIVKSNKVMLESKIKGIEDRLKGGLNVLEELERQVKYTNSKMSIISYQGIDLSLIKELKKVLTVT